MKKIAGWFLICLGGANVVVALEMIFFPVRVDFLYDQVAILYGYMVFFMGLFLIAVGGWAVKK